MFQIDIEIRDYGAEFGVHAVAGSQTRRKGEGSSLVTTPRFGGMLVPAWN